MAGIRSDPRRQGFPALTGRIMVDSVRGVMRVRAWPKKRGTPKSELVRQNNDDFRENVKLTKQAAASQVTAAMAATPGTGLYPRDLLMSAMTVGIGDILEPDGTLIRHRRYMVEDVMFQGVILQLDVDQPFADDVVTPISWPLPILDTAGFWNPAEPDRLTIPAGVEVVRLTCGVQRPSGSSFTILVLERELSIGVVNLGRDTFGQSGLTASYGPTVVAQGQVFRMLVQMSAAAAAAGDGKTFLTCEILQGG